MTSGKDVIDDIQKILTVAQEEAEGLITNNKELIEELINTLTSRVIMNSDELAEFFAKNPLKK